MRHYSQQIERDLKAVENQSIEEYIRESGNIASLHSQIGDCDSILERMESMLTNFQVIFFGNFIFESLSCRFFHGISWLITAFPCSQSVLSNISTEITTLQKKSVSMSVQLTNRQGVRVQLSQFIEDMAVPEEMIR